MEGQWAAWQACFQVNREETVMEFEEGIKIIKNIAKAVVAVIEIFE